MLAERLVTAVRSMTVDHLGKTLKMSVSVGVAARKDGDSTETWVARADGALYRAKHAGRDGWAEGND
jgi:diguanylate cyclase (GGDEF)-like protein